MYRTVMAALNGLPRQATGGSDCGHIVRLYTGQCHGTIRMADGREVWFHRSDMPERAEFNDFAIGDCVAFELLEDPISGARALRVRRNQSGPSCDLY
jgi:cold shock CspA family protein